MPHSCIGALSHYHHSLVDYVTSDEAKRVLETVAACATIYYWLRRSLKPVMLAALVIVMASVSVTKVHISDAALFAQRMRPCLYPPVFKLPSPEPVKSSPTQDAGLGFERRQASNP